MLLVRFSPKTLGVNEIYAAQVMLKACYVKSMESEWSNEKNIYIPRLIKPCFVFSQYFPLSFLYYITPNSSVAETYI